MIFHQVLVCGFLSIFPTASEDCILLRSSPGAFQTIEQCEEQGPFMVRQHLFNALGENARFLSIVETCVDESETNI